MQVRCLCGSSKSSLHYNYWLCINLLSKRLYSSSYIQNIIMMILLLKMTKNEEMLFHVFKKYKTVNFVNENNIFYEPSYSILFVDSFSA